MPHDVLTEFRAAMEAQIGVAPPEIIADGQLHRFRLDSSDHRRSGAYLLHADFPANGWFKSWRQGVLHRWRANGNGRAFTAEERRLIDERRREQENEDLLSRAAGRALAQAWWQRGEAVQPDHDYLRDKRVRAYGLKQYGNLLLVPARNARGELVGVLRIWPGGLKKFTKDADVKGAFHIIGEAGPEMIVAEGYATAATLHEASGLPVAVAFNSGNLAPVARTLREIFPATTLTIAGDHDLTPAGDRGRTAALEAAQAVGGTFVFPPVEEQGFDFNDLAARQGLEAVRAALLAATPLDSQTNTPQAAPSQSPQDAFPLLATLLECPELLRPPEAVIPRLAWRGRTTLHVGPDKSGKSTLWAHAVAAFTRGQVWLDAVLTRGRVYWIGLEEAAGDAVRRFSELGADPERIRLFFLRPDDLPTALTAALREWPAELVVIDSLAEYARVTCGAAPEDGDASGWGRVIRPVVEIGRAANCAIALLHHPRRSDGQYRGSGEIAAAVDVLWEMSPPRESEDPTLRRFKGRARWPVDEWTVRMTDGRFVVGGGGPVSLEARIILDTGQHPGTTRRQQRERIGGRTQTYTAAVNRLVADGALRDMSGGLFLPADLTEEVPF